METRGTGRPGSEQLEAVECNGMFDMELQLRVTPHLNLSLSHPPTHPALLSPLSLFPSHCPSTSIPVLPARSCLMPGNPHLSKIGKWLQAMPVVAVRLVHLPHTHRERQMARVLLRALLASRSWPTQCPCTGCVGVALPEWWDQQSPAG